MRTTTLNTATDRTPGTTASGGEEALARCAATVTAFFAGIYDELRELEARVHQVCGTGVPVTAAAVSEAIWEPTREMLGRNPMLGGGFVAATGFLSDHRQYLAWWQGDNRHLLAQSVGPWTGDPVDYGRQEWFRVPERTGAPHVTGPYVDYVCSDEYVVTVTAPVVVEDRLAGLVGADILLEVFESLMLPAVRAAGATIVNNHDRVVVSGDPRLPAGRLVERTRYAVAVECVGTPLTVIG